MRTRLYIGIFLAASCGSAAGDTSCHIHPQGSTPQNPLNIIGPFPSIDQCERERARRLGSEGRCHCQADFTPRWYPTEPGNPAGRDPSELL
jgi:hypothetical protein